MNYFVRALFQLRLLLVGGSIANGGPYVFEKKPPTMSVLMTAMSQTPVIHGYNVAMSFQLGNLSFTLAWLFSM